MEIHGNKTDQWIGNHQSSALAGEVLDMRHSHFCFPILTLLFLSLLIGARCLIAGGVRFSYSLPETLTLHEPVCLIATISNETSDGVRIDLGQDRKAAYAMTLRQPNGVSLELPKYSREGISPFSTVEVAPGQKFTQTLILNEWYAFEVPGRYRLQIRLTQPAFAASSSTQVLDPGFQAEIEIKPRDTRQLEATLNNLTNRIESAGSYVEAAEAATTLRYVADPLAVPFLAKALGSGKQVEPIAVAGLESIGNREAVSTLISALASPTKDLSMLARAALFRIESQTHDPAIKEQIRLGLQTGPGR